LLLPGSRPSSATSATSLGIALGQSIQQVSQAVTALSERHHLLESEQMHLVPATPKRLAGLIIAALTKNPLVRSA